MAEKSGDKTPEENSAQEASAKDAGGNTGKYLVFTISGERYAVPSGIIGEVAVLEKVFPMPLVPDYVRGLINRYSIPYALIDISLFLHKDATDARKVIVLKDDIEKIAFLIDDVIDIPDIPYSMLVKIEKEADGFNPSISAYFECGGKSVLCIDTEELVGSIKKGFEREIWK
ncbi:MAG: chemotaxis protein CheW [Treponema sp.]|nr:chemotaxis protein CheW [Treponema sp.]MCL2181527.1 chemotaxis protein CheW [Treponema sp.]